MTLQECKEQVAKEMKLDNFLGLAVDVNTIDRIDFWNEVAELYGTSQYNKALEDAAEKARVKRRKVMGQYGPEYKYAVNKRSILKLKK